MLPNESDETNEARIMNLETFDKLLEVQQALGSGRWNGKPMSNPETRYELGKYLFELLNSETFTDSI